MRTPDELTRPLAALARPMLRHTPARILRLAHGQAAPFGPPVGLFEREGAPPVELRASYRNAIKEWRFYWWPVHVLAQLRDRVELPAAHNDLWCEIASARALPLPPRDIAIALAELVGLFPDQLANSGVEDPDLGVPRIEIAVSPQDLVARSAEYRGIAHAIQKAMRRHGLQLEGARILDVGTGSGFLAFALAGLGAGDVVGVDLAPQAGVPLLERQPMSELLAGARADHVHMQVADAAALDEIADGTVDLVCSSTAIEHFVDLPKTLAEFRRVLRPGGLMHHSVDPWFGKGGGHSLCTLDFPWGHLRVAPHDFGRYVDELRPHEAAEARAFYEHGFQTPRRTLAESRRAFTEAGFELLEWRELPLPLRDPHRAMADRTLLHDCRRHYPTATMRDLMTIFYTVVARR